MAETPNARLVQIWSLPRSGHSPVIDWLVRGFGQTDVSLWWCYHGRRPDNFCRACNPGMDASRPVLIIDWISHGFKTNPNTERTWPFERDDRPNTNIIILRSLGNWLASQHRYYGRLRLAGGVADGVRIWKEHAREALGETGYLDPPPAVVLFDRWLTSKRYRAKVARRLAIACKKKPDKDISPSSWRKETRTDAGVLSRYTKDGGLSEHVALIDDEARRLDKKLFGRMGTLKRKTSPKPERP